MRDQFDVWRFDFPDFPEKDGEHPVVLISHPDICAKAKVVNVLFCTSQRQSRKLYSTEVMLNGADGLDWETFCDCSVMYAVKSDLLFNRRGRVTLERRRAIRSLVRETFLQLQEHGIWQLALLSAPTPVPADECDGRPRLSWFVMVSHGYQCR